MNRKFILLILLLLVLLSVSFWLIPKMMIEVEENERAEEPEKLISIRWTEELEKIESRIRAVEELGGRKDKSAVSALIEVLEDKEENWSVKIKAAEYWLTLELRKRSTPCWMS